MLYLAPAKAPASILNYSFDWADWLPNGATIQDSAWTADDGLTVPAPDGSVAGAVTTAAISGGTAGQVYRGRNTIVASTGETDTREVLIAVNPGAWVGPGMQADLLLWRLCQAKPLDDLSKPIPEHYEQAVFDAIAQINQDVPMSRTGTLNIVAGQATYDLPADFLFLISLNSPQYAGGVILSNAGIIPVGQGFSERHEIAGGQITFYPTPTYSLAREFRYAAGHVLVDGSFPKLTTNAVRIALLYAQHLVLTEQANVSSGTGWKYQIGDEMVDTTSQGKGLAGQAEGLLKQYQNAVRQMKGYGQTARYGAGEVAAWA